MSRSSSRSRCRNARSSSRSDCTRIAKARRARARRADAFRPGRTCRRPGQHTLFRHHRVHLRLQPAAQLHQLGPIADQLAQLPDRRRRDPRLPQPTQPQHVRQIRSRRPRRSSPAGHPSSTRSGSPDTPSRRAPGADRRPNTSHKSLRSPPPAPRLHPPSPPRSSNGSFTIRCTPSRSPSADRRTITERRRWKSIPTYCRSIGASSSSRGSWLWKPRVSITNSEPSRGAEAPLLHRIRSGVQASA